MLFVPGGAALWALLPLVASRSLRLGSGGYGLLLGAVGVGAVAYALPHSNRVLGANGTLGGGALVFAGVLVVLATVRNTWLVSVALLFAGMAWIGVLSTLNAATQTRLPGWVRARVLAVYLLVFQGGQGLAAPLWGALAERLGLAVPLLAGSGLLLVSALSLRRWPLHGRRGAIPRPPRTGRSHRCCSNRDRPRAPYSSPSPTASRRGTRPPSVSAWSTSPVPGGAPEPLSGACTRTDGTLGTSSKTTSSPPRPSTWSNTVTDSPSPTAGTRSGHAVSWPRAPDRRSPTPSTRPRAPSFRGTVG